MAAPSRISVIGLGYVGLPLVLALARRYAVVGYDHDARRIAALRAGIDRTAETDARSLRTTTATLTDDADAIAGADVFVITVPTPVDANDEPDLGDLHAAAR